MKVPRKLSIFLALSMLLVTYLNIPNVSAYVSGPLQSGEMYDQSFIVGQLCANFATLTRYDAESGENDPFFFPAVESHSESSWWSEPPYYVTDLKIIVTGEKPDGTSITGLEFTNLACLESPHESGLSWYDVLAVLFDAIDDLSPLGASPLLQFGEPFSGFDYDSSSAWAEWWWSGVGLPTDNKGLQFRFSLHCDPDLLGTYTLNIHYHIEICYRSPAGGMYLAATKDVWDTIEYTFGHKLSIYADSGGNTDPAPGTHVFPDGESVTVNASAYSGYAFDYWILDGAAQYDNPITVTMDSNHNLRACFSDEGTLGCPTLFVWSGTGYADEGILDIHADSDVTVRHEIENPLALEDGGYRVQLRELDNFTSHIDQVRLYAVDDEGEEYRCPLTHAYHSELDNVKHTLHVDDDTRVDLKPTERIDLRFGPPECQIEHFIFEINGYNPKPLEEAW